MHLWPWRGYPTIRLFILSASNLYRTKAHTTPDIIASASHLDTLLFTHQQAFVHRRPPQPSKSMDYYSVLGLSKSASEIEIRDAYKVLALELHPDKAGEGSTSSFQRLHDAYNAIIASKQPTVEDDPEDTIDFNPTAWTSDLKSWSSVQAETRINRAGQKGEMILEDDPFEYTDKDYHEDCPESWEDCEDEDESSDVGGEAAVVDERYNIQPQNPKPITKSSYVSLSTEAAGMPKAGSRIGKEVLCSCGCGGSSSLSQYHKKRTTDDRLQLLDHRQQQGTLTQAQQTTAKLQNIAYREKIRNEHKAEKRLHRFECSLETDIKIATKGRAKTKAHDGEVSHWDSARSNVAAKRERSKELDKLGELRAIQAKPRKEKFFCVVAAKEGGSPFQKTQRALGSMTKGPALLVTGTKGRMIDCWNNNQLEDIRGL